MKAVRLHAKVCSCLFSRRFPLHGARFSKVAILILGALVVQGCGTTFPADKIDPAGNLSHKDYLALRKRGEKWQPQEADSDAQLPEDVAPPIPEMPEPLLPPLTAPVKNQRLVSLTVIDTVPLRDVLIELAREGGVNLELDPRVTGGIIFTARKQQFEDVLRRVCALAGLLYRLDADYLRVELDEPYQESYSVDYLSLARRATSEIAIATNVFDVDVANSSNGGGSSGSRGGGDNNSTAKIAGVSDPDFWLELEKSLTQVLAVASQDKAMNTDKTGGNVTPANFSLDRQAGLVTVFRNSKQQVVVANYLRRLHHKASAQVLIEARIVEVELND